ncbi:MAG: hypothetical protein CMJ19_08975 [Phycisphaeraceae bacterium]|nr:hypothetical protein [Phycisphaeraceae bacterium]
MVVHAATPVMPHAFKRWTVYAPVEMAKVTLGDHDVMPSSLPGTDGHAVAGHRVTVSKGYELDIARTLGLAVERKRAAVLMTQIASDEARTIKVGASADWWMHWYVNGKPVFTTGERGNVYGTRSIREHVFELPLQAGDNLVSVVVESGTGGWKLLAGSDRTIADLEADVDKKLDDYLDKPFEYIVSPEKIRQYTLPSLMTTDDGKPVATVEQWENGRRLKLLDAFKHHVYGEIPMQLDDLSFEVVSHDPQALDGKADFRIIQIKMKRKNKTHAFHLELYTPRMGKPAPAFLLINNRRHTPEPTDPDSGFFPARKLIEAGFAAGEFNNKELAADNNEHFHEGVLQLYPELLKKSDGPRTISAWALGVIRCVDYLVQDDAIDAKRISVVGHSRGGKTALWAAVNDPRIAMTCPNNSGCTGTAIARRMFGETIADINKQFPYWFNDVYKQYDNREDDLPVDQHMLIALMAPRPVCVGSAIEDHWADPEGEYLSMVHATPVYKLYGLEGLSPSLPVSIEKQVLGQNLSYHIRHGGHGLREYDWQCYMNAARTFLKIQ